MAVVLARWPSHRGAHPGAQITAAAASHPAAAAWRAVCRQAAPHAAWRAAWCVQVQELFVPSLPYFHSRLPPQPPHARLQIHPSKCTAYQYLSERCKHLRVRMHMLAYTSAHTRARPGGCAEGRFSRSRFSQTLSSRLACLPAVCTLPKAGPTRSSQDDDHSLQRWWRRWLQWQRQQRARGGGVDGGGCSIMIGGRGSGGNLHSCVIAAAAGGGGGVGRLLTCSVAHTHTCTE